MRTRDLIPRVYEPFFGSFHRFFPIQDSIIPEVVNGRNVLAIAPTARGKTEAVLAPLAERALNVAGETSVIYISPTRALVNDLEVRMKDVFTKLGLQLAVRHGERNTIGDRAPNVIITTPESLDSMLSELPEYAKNRLKQVRSVVIDEVHQFYGTRRGTQLLFGLERLKQYTSRPLQRVLLSATVPDPLKLAQFFQGSDDEIRVVSATGDRELEMDIDAFEANTLHAEVDSFRRWINQLLIENQKVLIFANTRNETDWLGWKLIDSLNAPVYVHYSSLHRGYREFVEDRFRSGKRGVCVATSTLELGIDIGDIDAVVMYGAPHTVSSFMQRLGRGNRRTDRTRV